jgi:3-oxoacyl-[acyl-carrier-protein] synthase III
MAACNGFLFGVTTAAQFLHNNDKMKNALVIGADALSRWVDCDDRNTCILFGDAAGAMILQRGEEKPGLLARCHPFVCLSVR